MVWRSVIVAGYVALAITVGVTYGLRGFLMLCFFYFCATASVAFLLPWGSLARAAGRWNVRRLETPPRSDEPRSSRPPDGERRVAPDAGVVHPEAAAPPRAKRRPAPAI